MSRNAEKYREVQRNVDKYREMQRNEEKNVDMQNFEEIGACMRGQCNSCKSIALPGSVLYVED